jgi:hypothetical protein
VTILGGVLVLAATTALFRTDIVEVLVVEIIHGVLVPFLVAVEALFLVDGSVPVDDMILGVVLGLAVIGLLPPAVAPAGEVLVVEIVLGALVPFLAAVEASVLVDGPVLGPELARTLAEILT